MKIPHGILLATLLSITALTAMAEEKASTEVLIQSDQMWDGTPLPPYPRQNAEVSIIKVTFPPGVVLPLHQHPVINAGYMLKGELTVVSAEGKTLKLKEGDTLVELVNKWHHGINEGTESSEILVFYAGEKGVPRAILKGSKQD